MQCVNAFVLCLWPKPWLNGSRLLFHAARRADGTGVALRQLTPAVVKRVQLKVLRHRLHVCLFRDRLHNRWGDVVTMVALVFLIRLQQRSVLTLLVSA